MKRPSCTLSMRRRCAAPCNVRKGGNNRVKPKVEGTEFRGSVSVTDEKSDTNMVFGHQGSDQHGAVAIV